MNRSLAIVAFALAGCRGGAEASVPPADASAIELSVGLYPYVPRVKQFEGAIASAWAERHPDVTLSFSDAWDGGYDGPPSDLDVFVFDAINLDDFHAKGYLAPLDPGEVADRDDFLAYAIDGVEDAQTGDYLAVPMLGCTNILFYRRGDQALADAATLSAIERELGQCVYTSQIPPDARGLMLDMAGGTTNACMYADIVQSQDGRWPVALPTSADELDAAAIERMRALLATSSYHDATLDPADAYGRAAWFSEGWGRASVGFTESMSAMSDEVRATVEFKIFPFGDDPGARPLFYSDVIAVAASTEHRALAVELANLMASTPVMVDSMKAVEGAPAQYLMPTRTSVFEALASDDPIYARMQALVRSVDPILFNLGPDASAWIEAMKSAIVAASRADYPCACDRDAGVELSGEAQASEVCPTVCAEHGGWTGQWSAYPPGGTEDWRAACGCGSCSAP